MVGEGLGSAPGDLVTLDGNTGEIWQLDADPAAADAGDPADEQTVLAANLPELLTLEEWATAR